MDVFKKKGMVVKREGKIITHEFDKEEDAKKTFKNLKMASRWL